MKPAPAVAMDVSGNVSWGGVTCLESCIPVVVVETWLWCRLLLKKLTDEGGNMNCLVEEVRSSEKD